MNHSTDPADYLSGLDGADTSLDAANVIARSVLMSALQKTISGWGVVQEESGARLGISRPRTSELMSGKVDKFSLDALVNLAARAGLVIEIHISAPT
jgi:predicted XRE-type DNA-binding protein